jgi:hypothetical protein
VSSFYPGHGDNNHPLARLNHGNLPYHAPLVNDDGTETEDSDSVDDTAALSLKHPSKFSESLAVKVSQPTLLYASSLITTLSGHHGEAQVLRNLIYLAVLLVIHLLTR